MADIKFMLPDSFPLIPAHLARPATNPPAVNASDAPATKATDAPAGRTPDAQTPPTAASASQASPDDAAQPSRLTARVTRSEPLPAPATTEASAADKKNDGQSLNQHQGQPQNQGQKLTLSVDGKSFTVTSQMPLPEGSEVDLLVRVQQGKPQVTVTRVQLPPGASADGLQKSAATAQHATTPVTSTAGNLAPTLVQSAAMPGASPADIARQQAIIQLLASRLPLLSVSKQTNALPDALYQRPAPLSGLQGGAGLSSGSTPATALSALQSLLTLTAAAANTASAGSAAGSSQTNPAAGNAAPMTEVKAAGASVADAKTALIKTLQTSGANAETASATVAGKTLHNTNGTLPAQVKQILADWLQQLPSAGSLATRQGVASGLSNSGLSYEHKLYALADQIRHQLSQPAAPESAPRSGLQTLFNSVWAKAAELTQGEGDSKPAAGNERNPVSERQPASLQQAMKAVRERLEARLASDSSTSTTVASTPAEAEADEATSTQVRLSVLQQGVAHLMHQDHKAVLSRALLSLLNSLRPADQPPLRELPLSFSQNDAPEALRLLQTALARVETEQINRLQQGPDQPVSVPLFYRDQDQLKEVRLELKRDGQNGDESKRKPVSWHLRLHFDLTQLGPMDVELDLSLPRLSATFWSEQPSTLTLLNHSLTPLRQTLVTLGVDVSELRARHGQLPESTRNQIRQRLIDTHS
ncbi:flagellar hook-length control protein FliK [Thalassolituus sp. LLYu03]|uniref:flagellar hook-length control protein FliK n=1 Tax=Thalassolituus sp. LLYu03 TaxID=3421656 RepID=UPI003D2E518C